MRALEKARRLKYSDVGSRDAADVNTSLGGTSTAAGGAGALAFGGLDVGDGGDGTPTWSWWLPISPGAQTTISAPYRYLTFTQTI